MKIRRVLILLLLFYCLVEVVNVSPSLAQQNVMPISQAKLADMVMLEGKWQFHFGNLLSAAEMDSIPNPIYVDVPSTWNEYAGDYPRFGVATYYLKVVLDKPNDSLALNARITGLNYKVFVNEQFIGELGQVGNSSATSIPKYQNIIYNLPPVKDTLKLVYQVSNFHYRKGGMWRAPFLASEKVLKARKEKKLIIDFFLMGAIVFMGIYHLALNLFRPKNKLALYFAMVCFLTAIRSASVGEFVLVEYLNWSWWVVTRIEFISFFLLLAFTSRFIYHLFPEKIAKSISDTPFYFGIAAALLTIVIPLYYSSYFIPIAQLITIMIGLTYLFIIGREVYKGSIEATVAFIGLAILFGASVFEILMHHARLTGDVVFASGIFIYLFSHVIIIAFRTNQDYQKTEELSEALQSLNSELEEKVKSRTSQLDKRNEELEKVNQNLTLMNAEKDGILHVVAHDLKSPLNTTLGLGELLKKSGEIKSAEHLRYLSLLEHVNRQGIKFINDLLVLYQFEDAYKPDVSIVNLKRVFNSLEEKFQQVANQKSIKFEVNNKLSGAHEFTTDPDMLSRIVDNLLSNAFKYSFANTKVTLSYELTEAQQLKVTIKDQGQGIPESEHGKIFKKFQKISTKPTGKETSSGLGLSIVKQLVGILQGEISFESEKGRGTKFCFLLPELRA